MGLNLECSSKGDIRYSAFYAKIEFLGEFKSIEDIYQNSKRFKGNVRRKNPKGLRPEYFLFDTIKVSKEYLNSFYKLLWLIYLEEHPELVEYAKGFTSFSDKFKGNSINCQADVIKQYIIEGKKSIIEDIEPLRIEILMKTKYIDILKPKDTKKSIMETRLEKIFNMNKSK